MRLKNSFIDNEAQDTWRNRGRQCLEGGVMVLSEELGPASAAAGRTPHWVRNFDDQSGLATGLM